MTPKINMQIYEEACEWFIDFRTDDINDATSRDFDQWSRKSPEHLAAYLEVAAIWDQALALNSDIKWDSETLLAQALPETDNVFPITPQIRKTSAYKRDATADEARASDPSRGVGQWHLPYHFLVRRRLASTLAAIGLVAGVLFWHASRTLNYGTGLGEQRSIELADGSSI
jgi:ferric-dicitrate binding protein FerR (iron transport regulator)